MGAAKKQRLEEEFVAKGTGDAIGRDHSSPGQCFLQWLLTKKRTGFEVPEWDERTSQQQEERAAKLKEEKKRGSSEVPLSVNSAGQICAKRDETKKQVWRSLELFSPWLFRLHACAFFVRIMEIGRHRHCCISLRRLSR